MAIYEWCAVKEGIFFCCQVGWGVQLQWENRYHRYLPVCKHIHKYDGSNVKGLKEITETYMVFINFFY